MMRPTRLLAIVATLAAVSVSSGCWFGTGSTADIRHRVSNETGLELEPEFGMRAGRVTLGFARLGLKIAGEDQVSLKGLKKVEIGIYNVTGPGRVGRGVTDLEFPGWEPVVRVRENGEEVLVLLGTEREPRIRAMMVLVQDDEELVVVRARGKLDTLIRRAVAQHGWSGIYRSMDQAQGAS